MHIVIFNDGTLTLNNNTHLGSCSSINVSNNVEIGPFTRIASDSHITDTNSHFLMSRKTGEVFANSAPVKIGHHCWLANRCIIGYGSTLPPYTIIGQTAVVSRKTNIPDSYCVLAGNPAIVVRRDTERVPRQHEWTLLKYFKANTSSHSVPLDTLTSQ